MRNPAFRRSIRYIGLLTGLLLASVYLPAQDTLPAFTVKNLGNNRIIIGWVNNYPDVRQIGIQRSFDSLTGYKTILTVPDPSSMQNGYADTKAVNDHMFYRLYIQMDQGRFLFSSAKRPVADTPYKNDPTRVPKVAPPQPNTLNKADRIIRDSIYTYDSITRATPFSVKLNGITVGDSSRVTPNPVALKNRTNTFVPSLYVYTTRDGYVRVTLPDKEKSKKYVIKFFEEDNTPLFELKDLKESDFRIDKANFYHAGWFRFEVYEDGKLLERQRFYLEREF